VEIFAAVKHSSLLHKNCSKGLNVDGREFVCDLVPEQNDVKVGYQTTIIDLTVEDIYAAVKHSSLLHKNCSKGLNVDGRGFVCDLVPEQNDVKVGYQTTIIDLTIEDIFAAVKHSSLLHKNCSKGLNVDGRGFVCDLVPEQNDVKVGYQTTIIDLTIEDIFVAVKHSSLLHKNCSKGLNIYGRGFVCVLVPQQNDLKVKIFLGFFLRPHLFVDDEDKLKGRHDIR
jgi:hypothetical protein